MERPRTQDSDERTAGRARVIRLTIAARWCSVLAALALLAARPRRRFAAGRDRPDPRPRRAAPARRRRSSVVPTWPISARRPRGRRRDRLAVGGLSRNRAARRVRADRAGRVRSWISATRRSCPTCWRSPTGTIVDFPNSDRIYHNVFSLSKTRAVRSRAVRRRPLQVGPVRPAGHRPRVLRNPLAHERVHPGVQPPVLRDDRRRRPLPDRQRSARHLHRHRLERRASRPIRHR